MKCYAHVDADCFYVSCERLRAPWLKDRPVAVLGNQGACVIAASYEMKDAGVDVAMPIWKAKKICPNGIFIKRDFRWYGVLSRAMQEVLGRFTDHLEYYSIDESFLDLGCPPGDWQSLAEQIRAEMLQETGLPVSVGIAGTRTLCKMASKSNKPFGALYVNEQDRESILANTELEKVNGIGRRLIKRAHNMGLRTALDFAKSRREDIKRVFHRPGEAIWYELNGQPIHKICPVKSEQKVVSRGGSIWGHYSDPTYIWGFLVRNMERFLTTLWEDQIELSRMAVILRTSSGPSFEASEALPDYTNEQSVLMESMRRLFKKAYRRGHKYCRVHIVGAPLRQNRAKQTALFELEHSPMDPALKRLKAQVNRKHGLFALRNASTQYCAEVFKDKVSDFEITDVPGKHLF